MALVTNVVKGSGSERLLLLLHGYGADERDLGGLLPYLDPDGDFATVLPARADRGARHARLRLVRVRRRREPAARRRRSPSSTTLLDEQCEALGFQRETAIFAGFSQGAGLALGLALLDERRGPARPACSR